MLSRQDICAVDSSGLHKYYEKWPSHFQDALHLKISQSDGFHPSRILYAGLGGSAAPGDILKNWLEPILKIPFIVIKDYDLPEFVGKNDFVLGVSCAGDTEEVLKIMNDALKKGCKIAAISAGGRLEKFCEKNTISYIKIKNLCVSRASFPYLFYPAANILKELCLIGEIEKQLDSSKQAVKELQQDIVVNTPIEKNPSKELATKIFNGFPLIYVSAKNRKVATRFQASLNENAKMFAHVSNIPEICHNEVEIWTRNTSRQFKPLFLRHPEESSKISKRFKVMKQIIEDAGFEVYEIWEKGKDYLSRTMRTLYLLDYASIYTAILRKEDPLGTPGIDIVKRKMLDH
tara:strand:- start:527 stop:1564 length:1038 start_codon:yes stop_codon:yes gene_type:complete